MTPPSNTYTITIADAHSHSVELDKLPGSSKIDAVLNALQNVVIESAELSALTAGDTWTITVTQP